MQMMNKGEKKRFCTQLARLRENFRRGSARMSKQQASKFLLETMETAKAICTAVPTERRQFYNEIFEAVCLTMKQWGDLRKDEKTEAAKLCDEMLGQASSALQQEATKKEIVFLPYKASMWDSLESIWRAAMADREHCNVHVVVIPYADLTEDRQVREWHYEAELFPKEVSITHYNDIRLTQLRPDVIYIHNPYDYGNLLTSIDSNFYSEKLKTYTDNLVYVPYFVVGARWPEVHLNLPVYQYVDWIVVQREKMPIVPALPQISKLHGKEAHYMEEFIPPQKLLPLGAPKIDRLFYCERHRFCPENWKKFVQGRKVIMYNTSLSSLHSKRNFVLKKMKYIFSCFQKHREVTLLWRPHPLFEADLERFFPSLVPEYQELKRWFLEEQIGIFDDTPDIAMAVANSDAYLGEVSSSVVAMFGFVGKPIFLADEYLLWEEPTDEQRSEIIWGGLCIKWQGGVPAEEINWHDQWFIAQGYNAFCHFDTETEQVTPLLLFGDQPFGGGTYGGFCYYKGKIFFPPNRAQEILIYDPETEEQREIPYELPLLDGGNFGGIVPYENKIFFLPSRYPAMVVYDIESGKLAYDRETADLLKAPEGSIHTEKVGGVCVYGTTLLLAAMQTNRVVAFDMKTGTRQSYEVGPEDSTCAGMFEESPGSDIFWLFPWQMGPIRRWNRKTGECELIDAYPEGFECGVDMFNNSDRIPFIGPLRRPNDDQVWLFPRFGNMILRLQLSTKQMDSIEMPLPCPFGSHKSSFYINQSNFIGAFLWDAKRIAVQVSSDRSLFIIDPDTAEFDHKHIRLSAAAMDAMKTPMEKAFGPIGPDLPYAVRENPMSRSVGQFIEYVYRGDHDKTAQQRAFGALANNSDGTCGEKVHRHIMEQLNK